MNAINFVKEYGIEEAKAIVSGWKNKDFDDSYHIQDKAYCNLPFEPTEDCGTLSLFELKQTVDAFNLIESWGGANKTKDRIEWAIVNKNFYAADMMKHNLKIVEQCNEH